MRQRTFSTLFLCLIGPCCLGLNGCKQLQQVREFFQARPADASVDFQIDTTPRLGSAQVTGFVELDGKKVSDKTPVTLKHTRLGHHHLRVVAKNFIGQELDVVVKEGEANAISLALKPLPPLTPETANKKTADPPKKTFDDDPLAPQIVMLNATPPALVRVDGKPAGHGATLRLTLAKAHGEITVGTPGASTAVALTYVNRGRHVEIKPAASGDKTILVDGSVSTAGRPVTMELDQRPHRIEIVDLAAQKQAILLKLAD